MIKKLYNKIKTVNRAMLTLLGIHGKAHMRAIMLYIHYKN